MKTIYFTLFICFFILSTTYSQTNWIPQNSGTFENINSVFTIDGYNVWASGNNGKILKTTDCGLNWTAITPPAATNFNCITFINYNTGFAGGQDSKIYKTTNAGLTWAAKTTPGNYPITSLSLPNLSAGYAGNYWGGVLKTTDIGETWVSAYVMQGYNSKVFYLDDQKGWSVDSYGNVAYTINGGANYTNTRISLDTLSGISFISSSLGIAVGDSGRVFKSVNGGANWTQLPNVTTTKLLSVSMSTPNNFWVCGNGGIILQTTNGGTNWITQTNTTNALKAVYFVPSTIFGYIAGDNGTILRTIASPGNICLGAGLTKIGYPFFTYYDDSRTAMLYTATELINNGFTTPGSILKMGFVIADTVNSPQQMNDFTIKMQNYSGNSINSFIETGWTVVYQGTYTVTTPGVDYLNLSTPFYWDGTNNLLIEVCYDNSTWTANSFVNGSSAPGMTYHNHADLNPGSGCIDIITGTQQTIRPNICLTKEIVSGINPVVTTPNKFSLSQNYPNPFNPTTTIKYQISKNSFVTLKVYDNLGKEVAILVNENKYAGTYIVDFNASSYSSGVYYYRLESNGFVETKKMILLK